MGASKSKSVKGEKSGKEGERRELNGSFTKFNEYNTYYTRNGKAPMTGKAPIVTKEEGERRRLSEETGNEERRGPLNFDKFMKENNSFYEQIINSGEKRGNGSEEIENKRERRMITKDLNLMMSRVGRW